MARIVIIGASIGGLPAAYEARAFLAKKHKATVISNVESLGRSRVADEEGYQFCLGAGVREKGYRVYPFHGGPDRTGAESGGHVKGRGAVRLFDHCDGAPS